MPLTDKQIRFCEEYVVDLNATQAAIRAGYSEKTAGQIGEQNLKKLEIQQCIKEKQKVLSENTGISAEWVLNRFKEISDRCMQAVPVMERNEQGVMVNSGEYKFDSNGANKATEMIGKHIGFFEVDNKQKATTIELSKAKVVFK